MRDEMDCTSYPELPIGEHTFRITEVSPRIPTAKSHYRTWKVVPVGVEGFTREIWVNMFPWEAESLLMALGYEKIDNKIVWDDEEVIGKHFKAVIDYIKSDKSDKKFPKFNMFSKSDDSEIPF